MLQNTCMQSRLEAIRQIVLGFGECAQLIAVHVALQCCVWGREICWRSW